MARWRSRTPRFHETSRPDPGTVLTGAYQNGVFTISGELCLIHLEEFEPELERHLDIPGPMRVDVSQVREVDFAGLQLLLAFLRSRPKEVPTVLGGVNAPFNKALAISGLKQHFGSFED